MFQYEGSELCTACRRSEQDDFHVVKEYLSENPGTSVAKVVDDTGVSMEKIMKFLREDRLEIKGEDGYILECESCGSKIASGRFCNSCINNLRGEIDTITKNSQKSKKTREDSDKFRIIDRYK